MSKTATIDPGSMLYQPRGAARELFPCRALEVLLEGPAGTGKSRGALEKANRWALKCPGSRTLLVRKTRVSMSESVLVTLESRVIPDNTDLYPDLRNQQRKNRTTYEYPNGSVIVVGGMDNPDRIMSTEYDRIFAFEATELTEGDWEQLLTRLRNGRTPYHQIVADCNPGGPTHWLNQRAIKGSMSRLLSRHEDNPLLHDGAKWTKAGAEYLSTLARLTGARLARLLQGKWASNEGGVYPEFDAAVHVISAMPSGWQTWRKIRVIDFGYTNPFVCQWWAIDPDGRMYLYREIYRRGVIVQDHAATITSLSAGETFEANIADHDAEDRATLARHGITTQPAHKAVSVGIEAVAARLRPAGDGRPRLFILSTALVHRDEQLAESRKPTSTAEEFDGYVYPKGQDGKPMKEEPVKENDHGMDTARYAVMYAERPAVKRVAVRYGSV